MALAMTSLTRAKNGDWFARKAIPANVRMSYLLARHPGTHRTARTRELDTVLSGHYSSEVRNIFTLLGKGLVRSRLSISVAICSGVSGLGKHFPAHDLPG